MADPETIGELDDVSKDCLGKYASLTLLKQTPQLVALHTIIRDKTGTYNVCCCVVLLKFINFSTKQS